jgi:Holliday junction resolvase
MKNPEMEIQEEIEKYLRSQGWLIMRLVLNSQKGWPDVTAIKDGHILLVEVKTETGVVSPHQKKWITKLEKFGCRVVIATGVKHVESAVAQISKESR